MTPDQPSAFLDRSRAALQKLIQANKALGVNQEVPSTTLRDVPKLEGMYGTAKSRRQPAAQNATIIGSENAPSWCAAHSQRCDDVSVHWNIVRNEGKIGRRSNAQQQQYEASQDFSELRMSSPSGPGIEGQPCASTTPRSLSCIMQSKLMPRVNGGSGETPKTRTVLATTGNNGTATEACLSQNRQSDCMKRPQSTFEAWRQQGQVWRRALDDVAIRAPISNRRL